MASILLFKDINILPELLFLLTITLSAAPLVALFWRWGLLGAAAYVILGSLASNLQVLKVASFFSGTKEMALGTVIFTSLFWAFDLVTEYYGARKALQLLWLSFVAMLLMALWMLLAIAFPFTPSPHNNAVQNALEVLFKPAPALFIASLLAYLIGQVLDIWLFARIKKATHGKMIWLRSIVSTSLAGFVDHCLFTVLAFVVFRAASLDTQTLFWAYIVHGYAVRFVLSFGSPLVIYAVKTLEKNVKALPTE